MKVLGVYIIFIFSSKSLSKHNNLNKLWPCFVSLPDYNKNGFNENQSLNHVETIW
jgi:hypothetical protein